jgi:hypothetical protein
MIMYETFPFQVRETWSHLFFFMTGSFHFMVSQDQYYAVIQSIDQIVGNLAGYYLFLILIIVALFVMVLNRTINYRLIKLRKQGVYFFKWAFWVLEAAYFPIMLNVITFTTCQFDSDKLAVVVVDCANDIPHGYTIMMVLALFVLVAGLLYIVGLAVHLWREKISNRLNEEYIRKKEIEFTVGISETWITRYFFIFSSFRSELFKMYHRVFFNLMLFLFVLIHAGMPKGPSKIGLVLALFTVFTAYVVGTRPYRSGFSNILVSLLSSMYVILCFVLLLKETGMKSALFVDNYFYGLLILINGFGWFLVAAFLLFMLAVKARWPLDKQQVEKAIQGQELAIMYIKEARKFRHRVVKNKRYEEPERLEMEALQNNLNGEFNKLREKQALVMDALLEVIDQLKDMKKNYEENPYLYNYNFKEELKGLVHSRYRIYEIRNHFV